VTSRAISDCQSAADAYINMTAPVVSDARNVMIAMTATSARPPIESEGTIGVSFDGSGARGARGWVDRSIGFL
jgi:hypothetical protein